jgi:toluene monooxygenase system ferredoxin subunit
MAGWYGLGPADSLWPGELRAGVVAGKRVLVINVEGQLCAYRDRCAHLGLPLSDGTLDGHVLTCKAHGYRYDARTGAGIQPRNVCLQALPMRVEAGRIEVSLENVTKNQEDS